MGNIDERIEALTQSVELIAGAQLITERRMGQLTERMDTLADSMNGLTLAMKAIAHAHVDLAKAHLEHEDSINRLALIAGNHEDRIDVLEEGEDE